MDESGDLGFDFNKKNTSRYLVIGLLVCWDSTSQASVNRAVRRTLKNKLPKNTSELKGSNLVLPIKKYFLKEMNRGKNWCLYTAAADKKAWVEHHISRHQCEPGKKDLYDELAKRLFSLISLTEEHEYVDIIVDRSKNKDEIAVFDNAIKAVLDNQLTKKTNFKIRHRRSHEEPGLQAVDIFCSGIARKYERANLSWYTEFAEKIAAEMEYKF